MIRNFFLGLAFWLGVGFATHTIELRTRSATDMLPHLPRVGTTRPFLNASIQPIVHIADKDGKAFCSGIVFDAQYVATAAHCLMDDGDSMRTDNLRILDAKGQDVGIVVKAAGVNLRMDYGIVLGDFRKFLLAPIDFYNAVFLEPGPFIACGFAFGQKYASCSPFLPTGTIGFATEGQGMLIPGMSGGPVYNLTLKKVVAVNTAMTQDYTGVAGGSIVTPLTGLLGAFGIEP